MSFIVISNSYSENKCNLNSAFNKKVQLFNGQNYVKKFGFFNQITQGHIKLTGTFNT